MQRVVIVGAGGHAQVVADILMRARDAGAPLHPVGYVDDNADLHGQTLLGLHVLGGLDKLRMIAHDMVVIAIGDNSTRCRLFERLQAEGEQFAIAKHPSAVVAPDVEVGPGTMICAGVVVNPGTVIGSNVILNTGSTVDHHNRVASHAHIAPGVHLGGNVAIGSGVFVGIGATVTPQCRIGDWSVIGAGALVRADLPANVVAVGVPARIIRQRDVD